MNVYVFDEQSALAIDLAEVEAIAEEVVNFEGQVADEVTIHFVETAEICDLHARFFDDPSTTDCISFPMDTPEEEGYRVLGEVFVCTETAVKYAMDHKSDPYHETTLYIVHGLLHLMGYEDHEECVVQMREAEKRHLKRLNGLGLVLKEKQEEEV